MRTAKRWGKRLLISLAVLVGLLLVAWGVLYFYTEQQLEGFVLPAASKLPPGDAVAGAHLAQIQGCTGCHEEGLRGQVLVEIPNVAVIVAPNLTQVRERYDEAAFLRLMRAGTKADGRLALVMPNKAHQRLTDQQLADLQAYLHSVPKVENPLPRTVIYPMARVGMVMRKYNVEEMRADAPESAVVLADRKQTNTGRHLVQTACGECHGVDFKGNAEDQIPPLVIARAYNEEQFTRLLRTGITLAGTESASGMMSEVARGRFAHFSDQEIAEIKHFLDTQ